MDCSISTKVDMIKRIVTVAFLVMALSGALGTVAFALDNVAIHQSGNFVNDDYLQYESTLTYKYLLGDSSGGTYLLLSNVAMTYIDGTTQFVDMQNEIFYEYVSSSGTVYAGIHNYNQSFGVMATFEDFSVDYTLPSEISQNKVIDGRQLVISDDIGSSMQSVVVTPYVSDAEGNLVLELDGYINTFDLSLDGPYIVEIPKIYEDLRLSCEFYGGGIVQGTMVTPLAYTELYNYGDDIAVVDLFNRGFLVEYLKDGFEFTSKFSDYESLRLSFYQMPNDYIDSEVSLGYNDYFNYVKGTKYVYDYPVSLVLGSEYKLVVAEKTGEILGINQYKVIYEDLFKYGTDLNNQYDVDSAYVPDNVVVVADGQASADDLLQMATEGTQSVNGLVTSLPLEFRQVMYTMLGLITTIFVVRFIFGRG